MSGQMRWSLNLEEWANKTKLDTRLALRKIALEAFKRIIERSPVDTGRFRANWGCSTLIPYAGYDGGAIDKTGDATKARMMAIVNGWNGQGSIFIINNSHYGVKLEYGGFPIAPKNGTGKTAGGFSIQAPQGMVRITVAELKNGLVEQVVKGGKQ